MADRIDPLPGHTCVAIFGLGASGLSAAHLLASFGKTVLASDISDESRRTALEARLPEGTKLILGRNEVGSATVVVTSPGLAPNTPSLVEAASKGIPVIAELELGFRATSIPILAVTGTDGKTTTTTLTSFILNACGKTNRAAGNIGIPLSEVVLMAEALTCLVIETSAFQLPFCPTFRPHILLTTNIAEDHRDYFEGNWDRYVEAKKRPLLAMQACDVAILNASDPEIAQWGKDARPRCLWYGRGRDDIPGEAGEYACVEAGQIVFWYGGQQYSLPLETPHLRGMHNAMNIMCSVLGCLAMGCVFSEIEKAVLQYTPPPHRIQTVGHVDGIAFIDDSKATNPHAATAALMTIDEPLVLLAGGVDKGLAL
ncbi:MAG: UDP-N-acetylmuramoyl-L-alanine--D-glutamate ligase, partial [Proteobacteria bacterium]|nr:UDP-N-acetylmuramoyl-L-alanine--D-glutamate ligase [Pseudomonadota bacterium]